MTDNTRYYFDGKHYVMLTVEPDFYCDSPRDWFDTFTTMYAWCDRSFAGDDTEYRDVYSVLRGLVRHNISDKQLISYIKRGKTNLSLKYDRHNSEWDLYIGDTCCYSQRDIDWLIDDMIDDMSNEECVGILEEYAKIIAVPLCLKDYGYQADLSVNSVFREWDDCNGIAWTDKERVEKCFGETKNWKDHGYDLIFNEIDDMAHWVRGEVYVAIFSFYDWESKEFTDDEILGGFMSEECGDELFNDIAETDAKMFDSFEELFKAIA